MTTALPGYDGTYSQWTGISSGIIHTPLYDLLQETPHDGDVSYVYSNTTDEIFTINYDGFSVLSNGTTKPERIYAITIAPTVRTIGTQSNIKIIIRVFDKEYTSENIQITNTNWHRIYKSYEIVPNIIGVTWDIPTIKQTEFGLVFVSGDEIRCTKFDLFIHTEPYPNYILSPNGSGAYSNWENFPGNSPSYLTVSGPYDGDLSYLHSDNPTDKHSFSCEDMSTSPSPSTISQVAVKAMVKNIGSSDAEFSPFLISGGTEFVGGTSTKNITIPVDIKWRIITERFLNEPSSGWPSGIPSGSPWTPTTVNTTEIGVYNNNGDFKVTSLAQEVWLEYTSATHNKFRPTANGYYTDWASIIPGGSAYTTINEDPPDDASSYIVITASGENPAYTSFECSSASFSDLIYMVKMTQRVRLDSASTDTIVAPIICEYDSFLGTVIYEYIGEPIQINNTGTNWFDLIWNFYSDPLYGVVWGPANTPNRYQFGLVCLEGSIQLSRLEIDVQTYIDPNHALVDTNSAIITTYATNLMNRSKADGTIYAVTEFAIGTGGYNSTDPIQVITASTSATGLGNEIYRANIDEVQYAADSLPWTCTYYCRVPKCAVKEGIGEIGLFAEILWSPIPSEIGSKFLFALVHHPGMVRHENSVSLYKVTIIYP